jgi:hypothetical protein
VCAATVWVQLSFPAVFGFWAQCTSACLCSMQMTHSSCRHWCSRWGCVDSAQMWELDGGMATAALRGMCFRKHKHDGRHALSVALACFVCKFAVLLSPLLQQERPGGQRADVRQLVQQHSSGQAGTQAETPSCKFGSGRDNWQQQQQHRGSCRVASMSMMAGMSQASRWHLLVVCAGCHTGSPPQRACMLVLKPQRSAPTTCSPAPAVISRARAQP